MVPIGVVRVLVRKRDALAREVEEAEEVLAARRRDLEHVAATLELLIGKTASRRSARVGRRRGSLSRTLLAVLRIASRPMALNEIVDGYLAQTDQRMMDDGERRALTAAVRRSLGKLRDRGAVSAVAGLNRAYCWAINASRSTNTAEPVASTHGIPGRTRWSAPSAKSAE